jgi:hypothetical protein
MMSLRKVYVALDAVLVTQIQAMASKPSNGHCVL